MIIQSSAVQVHILPNVGGKIAQILDKRSQRELLVGPRKPYRQIPQGDEWANYDTSGMDDCFPNIAPGHYPLAPWESIQLPQLGEWVYGGWMVDRVTEHELTISKAGNLLPYLARKRVSFVAPETFEIDYSVENLSKFPLLYMWSAHPLFKAGHEFRLKLPPGELFFRTFPSDGTSYSWPLLGSRDLSCEWVTEGQTLKIFLSGLEEGWCTLLFPEYEMRVYFDLQKTPHLGLWFNNFGFPKNGPFRCIAIEPCTSQSDLLDDFDISSYPLIAPQAVSHWWLQVQVASVGLGP